MTDQTRIALLEQADQHHLRQMAKLEDTQRDMVDSLKKLVTLEERHIETREALSRAFKAIKEHDDAIKTLETRMSPLLEMRKWGVVGILGVLALVGTAAFKSIFSDTRPATAPAAQVQHANP